MHCGRNTGAAAAAHRCGAVCRLRLFAGAVIAMLDRHDGQDGAGAVNKSKLFSYTFHFGLGIHSPALLQLAKKMLYFPALFPVLFLLAFSTSSREGMIR